jgi:glycosyltransferase involved in cell wall biosynthesis
MTLSLVSILIPNYNKAKYIGETLDSILAQTYTNWECIVVDDHSTDNSWEILENYASKDARFKIYKRPNHLPKGGNVCRNYAFELSKGEFIQWFDSDDLLDSNNLNYKQKELTSDAALDFVICNLKAFENTIEDSTDYISLDLSQTNINYALHYFIGDFWIGTPVPLFRKTFLLKFNNFFNEHLKRDQEAEFFIRILLTKPKFNFLSETFVYWRQISESITTNYFNKEQGQRLLESYPYCKLALKHFIKKGKLDDEERSYFNTHMQRNISRMNVVFPQYIDLFIFGLTRGLFKSKIIACKIFCLRIFNRLTK